MKEIVGFLKQRRNVKYSLGIIIFGLIFAFSFQANRVRIAQILEKPIRIVLGTEEARQYQVSGWQGAYAKGKRSILKVSLPEKKTYRVTIKAFTCSPPDARDQRIEVYFNDIALDRLKFRKTLAWQEFKINIHPFLIKEKNTIKLVYSEDTSIFPIAFDSLKFKNYTARIKGLYLLPDFPGQRRVNYLISRTVGYSFGFTLLLWFFWLFCSGFFYFPVKIKFSQAIKIDFWSWFPSIILLSLFALISFFSSYHFVYSVKTFFVLALVPTAILKLFPYRNLLLHFIKIIFRFLLRAIEKTYREVKKIPSFLKGQVVTFKKFLKRNFMLFKYKFSLSKLPANIPYIVLLIIIYVFCEQLVYSLLNQKPPMLDEVHYLAKAVDYYRLLIFRPEGFIKKLLTVSPQHRPPLYPLSGTLLYLIFGVSRPDLWLRVANGLWAALTLWSTYKIGEKVFSRRVGLSAIVIFLGFFCVFGYQRYTMSETAFIAVTAFAVWQLIRTEYFTNFKTSLWFGISLALGLLVKTNFFFFLVLPVGFSFMVGLVRTSSRNRIKVVGNFLSSILVATVLSMPYYLANLSKITEYTLTAQHYGPIWGPDHQYFFFYLFALHTNISTPYFSYFIVGLLLFPISFFLKKQQKIGAMLILLWFLSGYLSHALVITCKDPRFTFAYYPAVALIASYWIFFVRKRGIRWLLIGLIFLFAICDHWGSSWRWGRIFMFRKEFRTSNPHHTISFGPRCDHHGPEKNNIRGLLKYLDQYVGSYGKANPQVRTVTGKMYNEAAMYDFYYYSTPHHFGWNSLIWIDQWCISRNVPFKWQQFLAADLFVLKTGNVDDTIQGRKVKCFVEDFKEKIPQLAKPFRHIKTIPINDTETYEVYHRLHAADKEEKFLLLYEALRLEHDWPENYDSILKEATVFFFGEWSIKNQLQVERNLQKFIRIRKLGVSYGLFQLLNEKLRKVSNTQR